MSNNGAVSAYNGYILPALWSLLPHSKLYIVVMKVFFKIKTNARPMDNEWH